MYKQLFRCNFKACFDVKLRIHHGRPGICPTILKIYLQICGLKHETLFTGLQLNKVILKVHNYCFVLAAVFLVCPKKLSFQKTANFVAVYHHVCL